jgi:hypothetical protein
MPIAFILYKYKYKSAPLSYSKIILFYQDWFFPGNHEQCTEFVLPLSSRKTLRGHRTMEPYERAADRAQNFPIKVRGGIVFSTHVLSERPNG